MANVTPLTSSPLDFGRVHYPKDRPLSSHIYLSEFSARPKWFYTWEKYRPLWFSECASEFIGVFFYVYAGVSATALFNVGILLKESFGSIFHIAFAYAMGISFAVLICTKTSAGHYNPALTVASVLFRGYPIKKAPYIILSQIAGAFCAALVVYASYRPFIVEIEAALLKAGHGAVRFTTNGTAGILAGYPPPGVPLKWTFVNEFFADFFIGLILWGALDPSNVFLSASTIPFIIGMAYFVAIGGGAVPGIATNAARDLGGRFAALAIWGPDAWGGHYAAVGTLSSIPATILAAIVYELALTDTARVVTLGYREVEDNKVAWRRYKAAASASGVSAGGSFGGLPELHNRPQSTYEGDGEKETV